MSWLVLALSSLAGGTVQTVTGFGAAVVMMLFLPDFLGMIAAPAIVQTICAGLSIPLVIRFWKKVNWRVCILPAVIYVSCSAVIISLIGSFDLKILKLLFGVFLVLLAAYFLFFARSIKVKANIPTAVLFSVISGVFSGLFGVGGPLMAVYFLAATEDKEQYIGTSQLFFSTGNLFNLIMRCIRGIYTVDLIPMTIAGIAAINIGKLFGLKILDRLDQELMKKIVYVFIGIAGVVTIIQYFL